MTQTPPVPAAAESPAWRSPRAWLVLLVCVAVALVIDIATKYAAFNHIADAPVAVDRAEVMAAQRLGDLIPPHRPVVVVPSLLELTLVLNPGAVFGMGAGKRWFFIAFTGIAVAFALWIFATWTHARERWAHLALGLLLAGGLGNLYDRIVYACVRDFLHPLPGVVLPFGWSWPWGGREVWPYVSNIADLWLIIGVVVLLVRSLRAPTPVPPAGKS